MRRIFLILFFLLSINVFADDLLENETGEVIQLSIKYNEVSARLEAFRDIEYKIDKILFRDYLKDKNRKENLESMQKKIFQIEDRSLCPFYIKQTLISYAITYEDKILNSYYYDILGSLRKVDIKENKDSYPKKIYSYSKSGNLISVTFEVDEDEQFIYDADGKLIAHWIGTELYDKENKLPKFLKIKRGG